MKHHAHNAHAEINRQERSGIISPETAMAYRAEELHRIYSWEDVSEEG